MTDKEFDFDDASDGMGEFNKFLGEVDAESGSAEAESQEPPQPETPVEAGKKDRARKAEKEPKKAASEIHPTQPSRLMVAVCIGVFLIGVLSVVWTLYKDRFEFGAVVHSGFATGLPDTQVAHAAAAVRQLDYPQTAPGSSRGAVDAEERLGVTPSAANQSSSQAPGNKVLTGKRQATTISISGNEWDSGNQIRLDVAGEEDLRALLSKEWMINANQQKQILQLEAQQAMLNLELIEQRRNTAASMRASAEASKVVLTLRDILRVLQTEVESVRGAIQKSGRQIEELDKRIEAAAADYQELTRLLEEKEAAEEVLLELMESWEQAQS